MRVVDKKRVGTRERDEFLKCDLKILFLCSLFLKIQILAGKSLLIFLSLSFS